MTGFNQPIQQAPTIDSIWDVAVSGSDQEYTDDFWADLDSLLGGEEATLSDQVQQGILNVIDPEEGVEYPGQLTDVAYSIADRGLNTFTEEFRNLIRGRADSLIQGDFNPKEDFHVFRAACLILNRAGEESTRLGDDTMARARGVVDSFIQENPDDEAVQAAARDLGLG